jgi:hypothetical protein
MVTNKHCHGCPINIHTEYGEKISNYGCLPCYADVIKWYKETKKVWACHENPTKPCVGFLKLAKEKGEKVIVNKNTVLITEQTTLDEIYELQ